MTETQSEVAGVVQDRVITTQPTRHSDYASPPGQEQDKGKALPDGLRQLISCKEIQVQQNLAGIDYLCCCNRPASYTIYDTADDENPILYVREISDCLFRQCLGAARRITLKITDDDHKLVAKIRRPLTCTRGCCCCACTLPELQVLSVPGIGFGKIRELRTCLAPKYEIEDAGGTVRYSFTTDCLYCRALQWFGDLRIDIYDVESGSSVAQIVKKTWKNAEELLSIHNDFIVRFLEDINISERLMIVGAAFLVDFNNFEDDKRLCC